VNAIRSTASIGDFFASAIVSYTLAWPTETCGSTKVAADEAIDGSLVVVALLGQALRVLARRLDLDVRGSASVIAGGRAHLRWLLPAADQFWGDCVGRIIDPAGHAWNIAARVKEKQRSPE